MKREDVYKAIDSERNFQDRNIKAVDRPDTIPDLHLGDTIAAIQYNLDKARDAWYNNAKPHKESMGFLRKVCGLAVQIAEKQGMPERE